MAKKGGNPQNLIPAKKGEPSRNPDGRPKLTEIEKEAREMTRQEHAEITKLIHTKTKDEIQEILTSSETPIIRAMRIRRILKDYENKDTFILDDLDQRNLGAPKQAVDLEATLNQPIQVIINRVKPE